jgi:hypothetical protein
MLVDHRVYTVRKGSLAEHLDIYSKYGFDVQREYLGEPIAFLADRDQQDGDTYIHLWLYRNEDDRLQKRAALQADPRWHAYLAHNRATGYLVGQTSKLMTFADFAARSAKADT